VGARERNIKVQKRTSRYVDGCSAEGFVEGAAHVPKTLDARSVGKTCSYRLAKHNTHVFDGVVLVHMEIPRALQVKVDAGVPRKTLEHMVKEPNARAYF
jgi:hypothetical protein